MFWFPVLVMLPSAVISACKVPRVSDVLVNDTHHVSWKATYEPGCLKGFQVCWTSFLTKGVSCDFAPPGTTSIQLDAGGMQPCERFNVEVIAVGSDTKYRDSRYAHGSTGPPKITGLKLTQQSRDLATLQWTPMSNHSCVSNVELWLCENSTQDLSTCMYKKVLSGTTRFDFQNFEMCRYYYAIVRAMAGFKVSPETTLEMYLDSANEVVELQASNVTQDAAVVSWRVSDVQTRCQEEKMKLCLKEEGSQVVPECWEWTLDQDEANDSISLSDLQSCAAYDVALTLITAGRHSLKTTTFTTPMNGKALTATAERMSNTAAVVKWSYDVDSSDCKPTVMKVCYWRRGAEDSSRMCRTVGTATHKSVRLVNLTPCAAYNVCLTLLTSVGPQPNYTLAFVTASKGVPVLKSMNLSMAGQNVTAEWTPADAGLQCVSRYNVSWWAAQGRGKGWRDVDADATSFTIAGVVRRATYRVEVAAVLADGTTQSLFGNIASSVSG